MSIDLDTTEGRKQYLSEKLDDLLEGINVSYGTVLMEELLSRLEMTVKEFNEEIKNLCDELVAKDKERQQLLEMLKTTEVPVEVPNVEIGHDNKDLSHVSELKETEVDDELDEDAPEWEKKLAKLEKKVK